MQRQLKTLAALACLSLGINAYADNQTATVSTVLPGSNLPFRIVIEKATFQLPVGFHSGVVGLYKNYWIFIAGRINGMHGFNLTGNFPADQQNFSIYVVNTVNGEVFSRSLRDPGSGLNQQQIDTLAVTSPEGYQEENVFYMAGGYGIDSATNTFSTKSVLTAFNLPGVLEWVLHPSNRNNTLSKNIRQINNPVFKITGGRMFKLGTYTHLVFGQDFEGEYTDSGNGLYSQQVRRFQLKNVNGQLSVIVASPTPQTPNANYRRRDLNVVPTLLNSNNNLIYGLVAYAGVFTPSSGVWNVPVVITDNSPPVMADPNLPSTFKQAMNQYVCATASLYSKKFTSAYNIFFGGLSYGFFAGGTFQTDAQIPFINQVTTVQFDRNGFFTQYLMDAEYPLIVSTGSNPGNPLLFGAGAYFIPAMNVAKYQNWVINLDNIRTPTIIGYVVGGIASTLPNTNTMSDSAASPYIFRVTLVPTASVGKGSSATLSKKKGLA